MDYEDTCSVILGEGGDGIAKTSRMEDEREIRGIWAFLLHKKQIEHVI